MLLRYLWIAAACFHLVAAFLFWRRGTIQRIPIICSWLVVSAARSAILLLVPTQKQYANIYALSNPLLSLLFVAAVVEIFGVTTRERKNFNFIGQVVLGSLGITGAVLALATQAFFSSVSWWQGLSVAFERFVDLTMAVMLIGSWIVIVRTSSRIPRAASRIAWVLALHVLADLTLASLMTAGVRTFFVRVTVPIVTGFVASTLWCLIPRWVDVKATSRTADERLAAGAHMDRRERELRGTVTAMW